MRWILSTCQHSCLLLGICSLMAQDKRPSEKEILLEKTFIEASREKILGNYQEAIAQYLEVLKKDANNAPANYELAILYGEVGQPDQALVRAERAVALSPLYIEYNQLYAQLLDKDGNAKRAYELYDPLIKAYPQNEQLYYEYSDYLTKAMRHDQAVKVLDGMEKLLGLREQAILRKCESYQRLDKNKKAGEELEKLANAYPMQIDFLLHVARFYQTIQTPDKAEFWHQKVLKMEPDNAASNLFMADKFLGQKDTMKYLQALAVMVEKGQMAGADKLKSLQLVASSTNERFRANLLSISQMMAQMYPELAQAHLLYAHFLSLSGQFKAAIEEYEMGLEVDKNQWEAWKELLETYYKAGDETKLLPKSLEAVDLFPNYPEAYFYSAHCYFKKGQNTKALEQIEYALPMAGSRPEWKKRLEDLMAKVKQSN